MLAVALVAMLLSSAAAATPGRPLVLPGRVETIGVAYVTTESPFGASSSPL